MLCLQGTSATGCPCSDPQATYLLAVSVRVPDGPEEVGAGAHGSALVRLLEQLGRGQGALRPQRLVVLLAEALHPLERADDQRDGRQLRLRIADLVFVQRKRLADTERKGPLGVKHQLGRLPKSPPGGRRTCALLAAPDTADTATMPTSCHEDTCPPCRLTGSPNRTIPQQFYRNPPITVKSSIPLPPRQ